MRCPSRGITLIADSLEQYGDERRVFMLGNFSYSEPRLAVKSDYLTYFLADERVVASGSVVATLPSGSTLRGPQAEYRRAVARVRAVAELETLGVRLIGGCCGTTESHVAALRSALPRREPMPPPPADPPRAWKGRTP